MLFDFIVVVVSCLTIGSLSAVGGWTLGNMVLKWWDNL